MILFTLNSLQLTLRPLKPSFFAFTSSLKHTEPYHRFLHMLGRGAAHQSMRNLPVDHPSEKMTSCLPGANHSSLARGEPWHARMLIGLTLCRYYGVTIAVVCWWSTLAILHPEEHILQPPFPSSGSYFFPILSSTVFLEP